LSVDKKAAAMTKASHKKKHWPRWAWPLGLLAAGAGGVAAFLLRGCWHTRMGWPVREGDHSYRVCLECGIKRLFDEKKFRGYGPYGYDVKELIARERATRMRQRPKTA
jgi:O-antigen ligase